MSSDKRRSCRIQGGSSSFGLQNEKRRGKREGRDKQTKSKYGNAEDGKERVQTNGEKYRADPRDLTKQEASHKTEEYSKATYVENSSYDLPIPEPIKPPVEIKDRGMQVLSKTENGESRILYYPSFWMDDYELFSELHDEIDWCQMNVVIHGKEYPQPRLVAWFGPFAYGYSGVLLEPQEMPFNIVKIKRRLENFLAEDGIHVEFNSVLLNLYQHGKHSVAWHSDDELSMGIHPTIASISLGEIRKFEMRRKPTEKNPDPRTEYFVNLKNGSLLVMDGVMQTDWQHRVPKEGGMEISPRINLTFRKVHKIERVSRTSK